MRKMLAVPMIAGLAALGACDASRTDQAGFAAARADADGTRYKLDPVRGVVWRLSEDGVYMREDGSARETRIELAGWVVAGMVDSCLPALATGPLGEAIVTSNVIPTLWRIDPDTNAVTVHPVALDADSDRDVGFTGIVYSDAHDGYVAVSHAHGSVWKIDRSLTRAEKWVSADPSTLTLERKMSCAIN